ncbi:3-keto-5-aminohexanoate cleavage protein [Pseudonocardia alni]|uniref:3-keto-5-aminohexanoate cleavage protein n=1 Tax=Pseudonocardia alni TaxID=33907 RepID=UPI0033FAD4C7
MDTAVILEVALNGTTTRERNPHVPRTPAEVAEQAADVLDAGAAIVHHHNDEPMFTVDGVHAVEPYLAAWDPVVAAHPDALLYPTMAPGPGTSR